MKKNLLSILILALLIVNIVLTTIMMISVTTTNKKTAAVVGDIATVLNLELNPGGKEAEEKKEVSIDDTAVYNIEDKMTIPLKPDEDGKAHYVVVSVSLAMNTKDKGYKAYGEKLKDKESLIKDLVGEAFGSYTIEQVQSDSDTVKADILKRLQDLFQSEFIYKVTFREMIPQ